MYFEIYYYADNKMTTIQLNETAQISFDYFKSIYPEDAEYIYYINDSIATLSDDCNELANKHNVYIRFHPRYTLLNNIENADISIYRSKQKFLHSNMSFSVATKSKALLVSCENEEYIHIPNVLRDKKLKIENIQEFQKDKNSSIFLHKKLFKKDFKTLIHSLSYLNDKVETLYNDKIPMTINFKYATCTFRMSDYLRGKYK